MGASFLALPLVPYALVIYTALTLYIFRRSFLIHDAARRGRLMLIGCVLVLVVVFILSLWVPTRRTQFSPHHADFGAVPGRSAVAPAGMAPSSFAAGGDWSLAWKRPGAGAGRAAFQLLGHHSMRGDLSPGFTTQSLPNSRIDQRYLPELISFLRSQGETRGYTNYWVEFPLAFLSGDELVFAARLPYRLDFEYIQGDNRYLPYSQAVDASPEAAYITTLHPLLDGRLRAAFDRLGVKYLEKQIGDYHVFYALTRKVTPEELGWMSGVRGRLELKEPDGMEK